MRVRVFQPFQKIWSPRTPDTGYDSLGITPPPSPIVLPVPGLPTEVINTTLAFSGGTYSAATAITGATETLDFSTKFVSGTYTA